jgi:hypothetical protein
MDMKLVVVTTSAAPGPDLDRRSHASRSAGA